MEITIDNKWSEGSGWQLASAQQAVAETLGLGTECDLNPRWSGDGDRITLTVDETMIASVSHGRLAWDRSTDPVAKYFRPTLDLMNAAAAPWVKLAIWSVNVFGTTIYRWVELDGGDRPEEGTPTTDREFAIADAIAFAASQHVAN